MSVHGSGGYVTLANANSYTGGTYILSGRVSQPTAVTFGTGPIYIFAGGEINPGANFPITFTNNVFIAGNGTPETGGLGALRMFQNTNGQNTQITGTVTLMETASICSNGLTQAQADASRNVGISGKITGPGGLTIGSPITTGGTNGVGIGTVAHFMARSSRMTMPATPRSLVPPMAHQWRGIAPSARPPTTTSCRTG